MKVIYRDPTPFDRGWKPDGGYDAGKLFYDQPSYAAYRAFEGFDFESEQYCFWDDTGRLADIRAQVGDFGPLIAALGARNMLAIGSGRPYWELLIANQAPQLRIVASDIHPPQHVEADLLRAAEFGFGDAGTRVSYRRLDIRDLGQVSQVLEAHAIDTIFICACFFTSDDPVWTDFFALAVKAGVRNVILLHAEEIAPVNQWRYRLFGPPRRGVFFGYLRSSAAIRAVFETVGMRCIAQYVPPQGAGLLHRLLARLRIHFAHKGYVFTRDPALGSMRRQLARAMRG